MLYHTCDSRNIWSFLRSLLEFLHFSTLPLDIPPIQATALQMSLGKAMSFAEVPFQLLFTADPQCPHAGGEDSLHRLPHGLF